MPGPPLALKRRPRRPGAERKQGSPGGATWNPAPAGFFFEAATARHYCSLRFLRKRLNRLAPAASSMEPGRSASPLASGLARSASLSRTPEKHRAGGQQHSEALPAKAPQPATRLNRSASARGSASLRGLQQRQRPSPAFKPKRFVHKTRERGNPSPAGACLMKRFALKSLARKKRLLRAVAARCAPCGSVSARRLGQVEALRWRDFF